MKYQIGEKIKIKLNLSTHRDYGDLAFTEGMKRFRGKNYIIKNITTLMGIPCYEIAETDFVFSEEMVCFHNPALKRK